MTDNEKTFLVMPRARQLWQLLQAALGLGPTTSITPHTDIVTADGTVAAGKRHIEFILSSDFNGTINGAAMTGANIAVYDITAPNGYVFDALDYTIAAGSAMLTTF